MNYKVKKAICLLVVAPALLIACSDDGSANETTTSTTVAQSTSSSTSASTTKNCEVVVGEGSGEQNTCVVSVGDEVTITAINPNAADEMHLRGYDLTTGDMEAGVSASISFTADEAGEFELESHVTEEVMMMLVVNP